jgi:hypothetical protein
MRGGGQVNKVITAPATHVLKVEVLVTDEITPRGLSRILDVAFEDLGEVLQFTVEGYGVDKI